MENELNYLNYGPWSLKPVGLKKIVLTNKPLTFPRLVSGAHRL